MNHQGTEYPDRSRRRRGAGPAVGAALAAAAMVAACNTSEPAQNLWPNAGFVPSDRWQATVAEQPSGWWSDQVSVTTGEVDGRPSTLLRNLDQGRSVTVHYLDGSGSRQSIALPAGGTVGVASPPARVVAVE